eukprot:841846-Prorocentrum_minimum.AAC.2
MPTGRTNRTRGEGKGNIKNGCPVARQAESRLADMDHNVCGLKKAKNAIDRGGCRDDPRPV